MTADRPSQELTPAQLEAVLEVGRTLHLAFVAMWEGVRPVLVKVGEAMQAVHEGACLPGKGGVCIVCHEPAHLRPARKGEDR